MIRACRNRLDSVLPLAQVVCAQLYARLTGQADRTIRPEDVEALGGVEGGIRRQVDHLIERELTEPEDRAAFRRLLVTAP